MGDFDAILIAGPTASGKSALALDVAARTGGVVVNADSMQVYRDLRILTARPSADEERRAPHRLYGHQDAGAAYSVGHWISDVDHVLAECREAGRLPIVVGGTGLYFKALLDGMSHIPPIPETVRARWRLRLRDRGARALHAELRRLDPASAEGISETDSQRLVRALEVFDATARPLAAWQADGGDPLVEASRARRVFLDPGRDWLYDRINRRLDAMVANGALAEVATLKARGLPPDLPAMRAHGVPHLFRHLDGKIDLAAALEKSKTDIRRYAKRQKTWFRHQMIGWTPLTGADGKWDPGAVV